MVEVFIVTLYCDLAPFIRVYFVLLCWLTILLLFTCGFWCGFWIWILWVGWFVLFVNMFLLDCCVFTLVV